MVASTNQQKASSAGVGSSDSKHIHFGSRVQHPHQTFGIPATPAFGTSADMEDPSVPKDYKHTTVGTSTFSGVSHIIQKCLGLVLSREARGTRITPYAPTPQPHDVPKIDSISAMPAYRNKSHDELRFARGTQITPYSPTPQRHVPKIDSISAMPAYRNKSHDELRFEDYKLGNKGVSSTPGAWCRALRRHCC